MSSTANFVALAIAAYAAYMVFLSQRSAEGRMGRNGPGIRIGPTLQCDHTWKAAQKVAAPIYRVMAIGLLGVAAITCVIGFVNTPAAVVFALISAIAIQVFFLGVASVRARKAAAAITCEHTPAPVRSPRAAPPHRRKKQSKKRR